MTGSYKTLHQNQVPPMLGSLVSLNGCSELSKHWLEVKGSGVRAHMCNGGKQLEWNKLSTWGLKQWGRP